MLQKRKPKRPPNELKMAQLSQQRSHTKSPKPRRYIPLLKKTSQQLVPVADEWFSKYIRLRDCERSGQYWNGKCITCNKFGTVAYIDDNNKLRFVAGWDNGHFISRGVFKLRWDEENTNLQCSYHCNKMKSGNIEKYKLALDEKYGVGTYRKLEDIAMEDDAYKRPGKEELLQIISDSKQQIRWQLQS